MTMVVDSLAERVGKPREPANAHADRQVVPLDVRGADVLRIGIAGDLVPTRADAINRAIAARGFDRSWRFASAMPARLLTISLTITVCGRCS